MFGDLLRRLFGEITVYRKKDGNGVDLYISHTPLYVLMKEGLKLSHGSENKRAAELIYSLDRTNIAAFLRGYLTGDGSITTNQHGVVTADVGTVSKQLADDVLHLLLYFGIVAKVYPVKDREAFRVCFTGVQNTIRFRDIGFLHPEKNIALKNYVDSMNWSRGVQIPMTEEIVSFAPNEWKNSATIGRDILLRNEKIPEELACLLKNDIYWDRVEEITEVPSEEYVYDISVKPTQNFVAGFGGVFAHNSEENLRKVFEEAEKNAPSIIFFDEIDAIAPKREEVTGEVERRVVSQLLSLMDGLKGRGKVVVIAATNRPNSLDPALRRGGRFDREIEVPVPDKKGRREIMQIHTRSMPMEKDVDIDKISEITYGFVGADLSTLVKEAAMHALRKIVPEISSLKPEEPIPNAILEKLKVTKEDFEYAMRVVQPSAMREVLIEVPKVKWTDVGGLEDVKEALTEAVIWQIKNPESFKRVGVRPPRGIFLYGPPGTGKTYVVKALANEAAVNLIAIKGPEVLNMFVGESEKRIREIFRRAKQVAPAIIFFDEIDAIAPRRGTEVGSRVSEQVVSQLLTEMSGIEDMEGVVIIASSNRPDIVDPALLRPGRFDRLIYVPAPEEKTRLEILKIHTRAMPLKEVDLEKIAEKTEGYSGADLEAVAREAGLSALRENPAKAKEVAKKHFEEALKKIKPSITEDMFKKYQRIVEEVKRTKLDEREATSRYIG